MSAATAASMMVYGTYHPSKAIFIDGLAGYSALDFDSSRFISLSDADELATGNRKGDQVFASLTGGVEFRGEQGLLSPYLRINASHTTLDAFSEETGGDLRLAYGASSFDTITSLIGLRAGYSFETEWGSISPNL